MTELPDYTEYDTRLAAYAVVFREDPDVEGELQMLLALWNEPEVKRWTLPGGGVELHESAEDGAVREVREETGYDVVLDRLLGVDTGVIPAERRRADSGRPLKAVRVLYTAHVTGGELAREVNGTTDEARWFRLSEVPDLPRVSTVDTALGMLAGVRQRGA